MSSSKKKVRIGSVLFRIFLIIIAGLTVGVGVFSWNANGLVGNQLPMPFGFGMSVVMSSSMEPVLKINDFVIVAEQDEYEVGDIVVYQDGGMLVVHRLVEDQGEKVVTKGDANNAVDMPIPKDQIKGKMVFRIPSVGVIVKFIKSVPGTLMILAVAVYLLYRSRRKERVSDQQELEDIVAEISRLRKNELQALNRADAETASTASDVRADADGTDDVDDSDVNP